MPASLIFDCNVYVPLSVAQQDAPVKEKCDCKSDETPASVKMIRTLFYAAVGTAGCQNKFLLSECVWRTYCVQL